MSIPTIPLTEHIDVSSGAHILYIYSSDEKYIENAVAFIQTGLKLRQQVIIIDSSENFQVIMDKVKGLVDRRGLADVHFVNHDDLNRADTDLQAEKVLHTMAELLKPLLQRKIPIRSWGHVPYLEPDYLRKLLKEYERSNGFTIEEFRMIGVWVYNGHRLPAHVQNELLQNHGYLMTDTSLVRSNLYRKGDQEVVFPSLAVHTQMQSEMNQYKEKLDFVHVVSHEVRNPLTVIKAYAAMLLQKDLDVDGKQKLKAITDYVDVIDNEIMHIINTEQMLSTEALWSTTQISVLPVLEEVIATMKTKSRTQNIELHSTLPSKPIKMVGNVVGMKLVVSNLLSNAIKYSEENSCIWMEVHNERDSLHIQIKDQGIGMTGEQTQKLFRKYEKMNLERSGQGIGLFMVKKLVDHFEGFIEIHSELHKGTQVLVRLPIRK
ncbi:GHKL domain-containing protein [Paenibacillus sp. SYP-B3998]|uniref:histidine kinase n=1 Tax=Paenibacillus sp. SYP-B3998 TaxID=2678564 RepID=A0A6G4A0E6_9BACL|nr:ATP-binding protein [Paenibacillus sp. SYP-B3998]NEW07956.1 GHKL domain-containing protein [Paenibacillus sp. SYP-B3998]